MPRAPWRRRATDTPRPAGRRWTGRLRRSRVLAWQVLRARPRRRAGDRVTVARAPLAAEGARHTPHRTRREPYRPATLAPTEQLPDTAGMAEASSVTGMADAGERRITGQGIQENGAGSAAVPLLPGIRTMRRQVCFLLVTCVTMASLGLGVLAILLAMRGDVQTAAICLVACVVLDGADGFLARLLRVTSPFGAQMDSLADMCAFGIAAPVVVYASVTGTVPAPAAALACAMVAGCAAIRLARFNVSPKDGRFFTGVPTTLAAAVLALVVLIELPLPSHVLLLGVAVLAVAMVSSFPYATLARLLRLPPWLWLAPVAGALVDARLTFVVLVGAYLASGPLLWLHHRRLAV